MKKNILVFTKYYLPAYKAGGPIRSVSNMIDWLSDDYEFKVISSDRDLGDESPFENKEFNCWLSDGKSQTFYLSGKGSWKKLADLVRDGKYDLIYLNSFFDIKYSIFPLIINRLFKKKPVLLSPRGEFSSGALAIKSLKKQVFLKFINKSVLFDDIYWGVTNDLEKNDLISALDINQDKIYTLPNLPSSNIRPLFLPKKKPASLKIAFLSRVSPKKNLKYVIEILSKVSSHDVELNMYGVIDDRHYWEEVKKEIKNLPKNVKAIYRGTVRHDKVFETIEKHHLFFLPTLGENFGHAISESLLSGTPVLISDQTPWRNLEEKGLGHDLSLSDRNGYLNIITKYADMSQVEMNRVKEGVYSEIRKKNVKYAVEQSRSVLQKILEDES
ncbi:glycosyltransferase family 4 protein [Rhodohalobacter sp. 8-1]|uniref:glycosyltransferase family 4 protein n=1 Tax=Rhodohalobacter sp. 8-1 TaxID=3131972 RepID=UPI0030EFA38F